MEWHYKNANLHQSLLFTSESFRVLVFVQCRECVSQPQLLSFLSPWTINSHTISFNHEQDWEHLCGFYDLFKLCGPTAARNRIKRLWPHKKWLCFQHWTAPKILLSNNCSINVCEMRKRRRVVTLSYLEVILNLSCLEGSRQISPQHPLRLPRAPEIQRGLNKPANQSPSALSLGGTNAAHQANH